MKSSQADPKGALPAPPLRVWWAAAAAFAGLFLLTLPLFHRYKADEKLFVEASLLRLESFSAGRSGKKGIRVIAAGSSLMARATLFDWRMEDFAGENGLEGVGFLRMTRPSSDLADFSPLFGKIFEALPDIILIESESVFYVRRDKSFFREYPDFLRTAINVSLKAKKPALPKLEADIQDADLSPLRGKKTRNKLKAAVSSVRNWTLAEFEAIEPFFREAAARGIRVVLLDIRRAPEFEELAGIDAPDTGGLLERLENEYGVTVIGLPEKMGTEYYSDHAHINEEGRVRFSSWLVRALKGMTEGA